MRSAALKYSLRLVIYVGLCVVLALEFLEIRAADRETADPLSTAAVDTFSSRPRASSVQEPTVGPPCVEEFPRTPERNGGKIKVLDGQTTQSSPKKKKAANGTPPGDTENISGSSSYYTQSQSTGGSDLRSTIAGESEDDLAAGPSRSTGLDPLIAELQEKGLEDTNELISLLEAASEILGFPWDFGASLRALTEITEEGDIGNPEVTIMSFDRYWEILIKDFRSRPDLTFSQFRQELTGHPIWQAAKYQIECEVLDFVDHLRFPENRHHAYTKEDLLDDLVNDLRLFMERVYARQQMLEGREWGLTLPFFYSTPKKTIFVGRREAFVKLDFDRLEKKLRNKGSLDAKDTWQLGSLYEDGGIIPYGKTGLWLDRNPSAAEGLYEATLKRYYDFDTESDIFTEIKEVPDTDYTNSLLINLARLYTRRLEKQDLRQKLVKTAEKEGDFLAKIILADERD